MTTTEIKYDAKGQLELPPDYTLFRYKANVFAAKAHAGQVRKYTGEPYIVHPYEVYSIVLKIGGTDDMLAAALLHDTVEDTSVTISDIRKEFSPDIADLVADLTDVSQPEDGNRAVRKEIDRQHTAQASPEAKTIKLADLISNSKSIVQHDPSFAKVYMKEKTALLEVLTEGNASLHARASEQVNNFQQEQ